ncbi:hypothetical protein L5515_002394 [Caenorhabditis briggsae]|uniref:Uncharacterized protein n=1 Tax=Caenorhabditis briggsae TaxID=6238 RepID=A0AAE9J487_CAEBR|nr:hypothetical protein L5515_002394 [Caenorhabditis briggsae]
MNRWKQSQTDRKEWFQALLLKRIFSFGLRVLSPISILSKYWIAYCLDVVGRFETACKTYFKSEKATKCVNLAYPALEKFCKLTFFRSASACKKLTTTLAPTTTTTTTVIPKILPAAITDPTDSPTTAGFPIFPLIGVAFGIIFLVAVGISLFLFCRKQNKPSAGQKGPSKMEESASKTGSIESKSKSVVASPEKTGGDSKIEGKSEIGGKSKNGKSKIGGKSKVGGKPEKSMMKPRNDGRSAFMYTG